MNSPALKRYHNRPLTREAAQFGIVWEAGDDGRTRVTEMGMVIFTDYAARDEAERVLVHELGFDYVTHYNDVQGPALSFCKRRDGVERWADGSRRNCPRWRRSYR